MISASKSFLSLNNLKILSSKVTKNLQNCVRRFVNPHPASAVCIMVWIQPWKIEREPHILESIWPLLWMAKNFVTLDSLEKVVHAFCWLNSKSFNINNVAEIFIFLWSNILKNQYCRYMFNYLILVGNSYFLKQK